MQKIGLLLQKLAEIRIFLVNWTISWLRHKKPEISDNVLMWGPIFLHVLFKGFSNNGSKIIIFKKN